MPATATQSLVDRYTTAFAGSKKRFEEARKVFPCGVTHDARMMEPFPIYITHAKGAKWDVDGHELMDYFVGHGSHLLGHWPDDVVKAVQEQMAKGTHYGACHDLEIEWGQLVQQLVPSAERVRFTGSGTEATLMALRLSRLFTGKPKFLKFHGHFHGWHDYGHGLRRSAYDSTSVPGVPEPRRCLRRGAAERPQSRRRRTEERPADRCDHSRTHRRALGRRADSRRVPEGPARTLHAARPVLIFDEVITGFRVSPGGRRRSTA